MNPQRLAAILSGEERTAFASALRAGTAAAEPFYRAGVAVRNAMFDWGLRKPVDLGRPTISVGNITTGGTGKTPMVIEIVKRLKSRNIQPVVLLRGYGAKNHRSDEAQVLRMELGFSFFPQVEVNPNRIAAARDVLENVKRSVTLTPEDLGAANAPERSLSRRVDAFILDDGFQHRQARRNLNIVLIDATNPFGFGHLLPRGLLREPLKSLRRADAIIVTRADGATPDLDRRIEAVTGRKPLAHANVIWNGWQTARPGESYNIIEPGELPAESLASRRVLGLCAIGNPRAFERQLRGVVGEVAGFRSWPDHHPYSEADLVKIYREAKVLGVDAIVMTTKDWVKWMPLVCPRDHVVPRVMNQIGDAGLVPIFMPVTRFDFLEGTGPLDDLLHHTVP